MELTQFNAEQLAVLGAVIVGITELISRLRAKDYWVAATIVCAAVVGALVAVYYDLDALTGVVAAFGASGVLRTLGSVGNKSTPAPSTVLDPTVSK